ncbi:hypothetical protein [Corynebacterium gerontici]|uniref:Uncharacterized protein n=1 Tax=Corynebacterium gerontici TaxID=2079234 RepID=A0A3G6J302_9CORY|nr:hypothetical protein [Corynebacterium gerontici]AZA10780.1 hypothetical protein CGERO_02280 [Corynebacterium gerontici]
MVQTGVRKMVGSVGLNNLSELSRHERIALLRSKVEAMTNAAPARTQSLQPEQEALASPQVFAVPGPLAQVLPDGGLAARCVTHCSATPSLIVEMIAHLSSQEHFVAVVGWPELNLAGVADAGGDYSRIVVVPDPGEDPLSTVAVLLEGIHVVIFRGPSITLSPVRARPLLARLRSGVGALVLVDTQVVSPRASVHAEVRGFRGIGEGQGRIQAVDLELRGEAKAFRARATMSIGKPRALHAVPQ